MQIIKDELTELRERYGDERRTLVIQTEEDDILPEDMIPNEEMVITISNQDTLSACHYQNTAPREGIGFTWRYQRKMTLQSIYSLHRHTITR